MDHVLLKNPNTPTYPSIPHITSHFSVPQVHWRVPYCSWAVFKGDPTYSSVYQCTKDFCIASLIHWQIFEYIGKRQHMLAYIGAHWKKLPYVNVRWHTSAYPSIVVWYSVQMGSASAKPIINIDVSYEHSSGRCIQQSTIWINF